MSIQAYAFIPQGQNAYWMTTAPPGITINQAWTANGDVSASGISTGLAVGDFWRDVNTGTWGGSTLAPGQQWFNTSLEGSSNINSQIYGIQLVCTQNVIFGGCPYTTISVVHDLGDRAPGHREFGTLRHRTGRSVGERVVRVESAGRSLPSLAVLQRRLRHLLVGETAGTGVLNGPPEPRDDSVWQQCPNPVSWSFNVDTRSQVPTAGTLPLDLSATNAAGVASTSSEDCAGGQRPSRGVVPDSE